MKIFNTKTKKIEEFKPILDKELKMYVCGPTVYNLIHIGNARPIIFFDVLARYFKYHLGYNIKYVQNFTDVDDKIINKAKNENISALDVSKKYIEEFNKDISKLNLIGNILRPKVSENIQEIIDMISILLKNDNAYMIDDDVYFQVSTFKNYGEISNQLLENFELGKRIEINNKKRDPKDFALWKAPKEENEIFWESPFSKGRPGWHIECSALIKKYLGDTIDIHGGGQDLIFPHHENENAQSNTANDKTLSNYWIHNGYVNIENEKMSKSIGNTILLREFLDEYGSNILKMMFLNTHYRKPINFSKNTIASIKNTYENMNTNIWFIETNILNEGNEEFLDIKELEKSFYDAMEDDFNTSLALSSILSRLKLIAKYIRENRNSKQLFKMYEKVKFELTNIFGIELGSEDMKEKEYLVNLLLEIREELRAKKDYAISDKIRDELAKIGIQVNDKKLNKLP